MAYNSDVLTPQNTKNQPDKYDSMINFPQTGNLIDLQYHKNSLHN